MTEFTPEKRYQIFLNLLQKELGKMFSDQSEFIVCKEGCSYCCEQGEYPFSEIEFNYLLEEYKTLAPDIKQQILFNIAKVNEKLSAHKTGKKFMYDCPFLINKRCSVYEHRGIICRTFGLLCEHDDGRLTIPFCHDYGLNYAKVYSQEKGQIITTENGEQLCKTEPKAFKTERTHIQNLSIAKNLNIDWGESKTLIDLLNESNITEL